MPEAADVWSRIEYPWPDGRRDGFKVIFVKRRSDGCIEVYLNETVAGRRANNLEALEAAERASAEQALVWMASPNDGEPPGEEAKVMAVISA